MNEQNLHHGVVSKGKVKRFLRRASRPKFHKQKLLSKAGFGMNENISIPPVKIKNQFQSSSCGGQAASYFLEIENLKKNGTQPPFSAKSIYAPIAYPTGGTTVYALETQVGNLGASLESTVPSYKADGTTDEPFMTDMSLFRFIPKIDGLVNAGRQRAITVKIDFDSIANAIATTGAVILEVKGQNNGTWTSATPLPPSPSNPNPYWAHLCWVCLGVCVNRRIEFVNSWGDTIGFGGHQWLSEAYINSGNVVDCFTFLPVQIQQSGWLWNVYQKLLHKFFT